jgi:hypothetical protein
MMAVVELPGGHSATVGMRMAEFRELWASGAVAKLQAMTVAGGDMGDAYPLLVRCVRTWDLTAEDGRALDPAQLADYDELEPGTFMKLLNGVSRFLSGEDSKN